MLSCVVQFSVCISNTEELTWIIVWDVERRKGRECIQRVWLYRGVAPAAATVLLMVLPPT